MGKSQKRKRGADDADDHVEQPSSKLQIVADGSGDSKAPPEKTKKGGQRRQIRSERKKKRALQARENALKKREAALLASDGAGKADDLAAGHDFVSLGKVPGPRVVKEKRRSPRSIRKEQKQQKIAEAMEGVYADDPILNQSSDGGQLSNNPARFICFVGNLPFTATSEQVKEHFSKLRPKGIRLSTDKDTGECKGFGFLEFDNYDKLKTCLKMYHHSLFNPQPKDAAVEDGEGAVKSKPRKINVELTAGGGGGKSTGRKDKIKKKNKRLNDERSRDFQKKSREKTELNPKKEQTAGPDGEQVVGTDDTRGAIHPSRLSRVGK